MDANLLPRHETGVYDSRWSTTVEKLKIFHQERNKYNTQHLMKV